MAISFLFLLVGLGGCALLCVVLVSAVWAITYDRHVKNNQ